MATLTLTESVEEMVGLLACRFLCLEAALGSQAFDMNIITKRAIRLAIIVEAISCVGMIFRTEPYGFWDKVCESLGMSPFAVSEGLAGFFFVLHLPFVFMAAHLFHDPGFEVFNGRLVLTSPLGLLIILLQFMLWIFIFMGLMRLWERAKLSFRRNA